MSSKTIDNKDFIAANPTLHASVRDGMYGSVMLGAGDTYLGAFGIFLQATTLQIGLLASIPPLLGGILQVISLRVLRGITSRRSVLVFSARLQACVWFPIAILPFLFNPGPSTVWILIGLATLYQCGTGLHGPTWSSLIGDLVPQNMRGRFFGFRNQRSSLCSFVAIAIAGQVLDLFKRIESVAIGFFIIFLIAGLARLRSSWWLTKYDDPPLSVTDDDHFTLFQFIRRVPKSNYGRFVFYTASINFAVAFSGPYFTLYLLRDLHCSYIQFTIITAASALFQFLTMQYWGKIADVVGSKNILNICGVAICTTPLLWLFSSQLWYLVLIQIYSGALWAGYSLATSTFLFDAVTPPKRARCAAYQAFINGVFLLAGSFSGGYLSGHLPTSINLGIWTWEPTSGLLIIFLLSSLLRVAVTWFFLPKLREVREVSSSVLEQLNFRMSLLRPLGGITFSIVPGRVRPKRKQAEHKNQSGGNS